MLRTLVVRLFFVCVFLVPPVVAQTPDNAELMQAQQMLANAEAAGARTLAVSLYDDAAYRIRFAQENWSSPKPQLHEQARMRAREATFAARAALAKARWQSTNSAVRSLQTDIRGFGGTSDIGLQDEDAQIDFHRGTTSANRIAAAAAAIAQAKAIGADSLRDSELVTAQQDLDSARKVTMNGKNDNDVADHLAYIAEMIARSAYYTVRFNEVNGRVPDLQLQRTRLAQGASERQAAQEREQREAAERHTVELQQQLAAEQQNRQSQQAELDRLRQQVDEQHRAQQARVDADRNARVAAEQRLDELTRQYQTAITNGAPTADVDSIRRQIEDQQFTLHTIQQREQFGESALETEISRLRSELEASRTTGSISAQVLQERQITLQARQAELETLRKERETDMAKRVEIDRENALAIADAQKKRQEAEAQLAQLREQAERAAQEAQKAALEQQQQAQRAQEEAQQQIKSAHEALEKSAQQNDVVNAELDRTKRELATQTAETNRLRLQSALARFASTRADTRGVVVTLPSMLFDPGKSTLKPAAKSTLKKIAEQLKSEPTLVVTVEGHTDNVGGAAKNLKLSEARAKSVRDYFVANGISTDHITAIGKGEADPIAPNKTASGRQQNRRVELILAQ